MSLPRERSRPTGASARSVASVLFVIALAAGGCSGDDDSVAEPPSTTRPTVTTSTTVDDQETAAEIQRRYEGFWDARFAANQPPPNPDHPALRSYATGQQLEQVVQETRKNLEQELALRHAEAPAQEGWVKVLSVDGETAIVQECVVDDDVVYRYTTNEVVNAEVATHSVRATMRNVGGDWKVEAVQLVQRWDGVAGCARAGS